MGLEQEVISVESIKKLEETVSASTKRVIDEKRRKINKIQSGKATTGDKITDFTLVNRGIVSKEAELPYRQLAEKCVPGAPVMIVHEEKHTLVRHRPHLFNLSDITLKLGIMKAEVEFDIKECNVILPTETYAHIRLHRSENWQLEKRNVGLTNIDYLYWLPNLNDMQRILGLRRESSTKVSVLAGKEVDDYFTKHGYPDPLYAKGLILLNAPIPEPFKSAYTKELNQNKEAVLQRIVQSSYRIASHRNGSEQSEKSRDGQEYRASATSDALRKDLSSALELELHLDIAPRQWRIPGMTLVPSDLIKGLCTEYKIKIP